MEGILAIIMIFGIPIVAIVGGIWLKGKKLSQNQLTGEDKQLLTKIVQENEELKRRMENMEMIVSEVDTDLIKLNAHSKNDFEKQIEQVKSVEKMKRKS